MFKKTATILCFSMLPLSAMADGHITGDAEKGERVFKKCKACHAVGTDAKNKAGPILNGLIDRQMAQVEDFKYSDVLVALGEDGKTWSPEELSAFLEKPRTYAKGTKMSFAGLRKEKDRDNVIAFLASFDADGNEK